MQKQIIIKSREGYVYLGFVVELAATSAGI